MSPTKNPLPKHRILKIKELLDDIDEFKQLMSIVNETLFVSMNVSNFDEAPNNKELREKIDPLYEALCVIINRARKFSFVPNNLSDVTITIHPIQGYVCFEVFIKTEDYSNACEIIVSAKDDNTRFIRQLSKADECGCSVAALDTTLNGRRV